MKKSDELKLRSADNLQIYGAYLGGNDFGAQDYTKAIQLRGVRIVDAKWLENLAASHDDLLDALEAICLMQSRNYGDATQTHLDFPELAAKARAAIAKARSQS